MTKTQHKRTAVASMFQNGISQNTKCAERDGFCREGHILHFNSHRSGFWNIHNYMISLYS